VGFLGGFFIANPVPVSLLGLAQTAHLRLDFLRGLFLGRRLLHRRLGSRTLGSSCCCLLCFVSLEQNNNNSDAYAYSVNRGTDEIKISTSFGPIYDIVYRLFISVADPGCLARITDSNFSIPDSVFRVKKILDPGSGSALKNLSLALKTSFVDQ
jgi:hypothetical protein